MARWFLPSASLALAGAVGIVGVLLVWWLLAGMGAAGGTIPTPVEVITTMVGDGTALYGPNFAVTSQGALQGFLWGNGLAIALAVLVVLIPPVESLATQLAILSYCNPVAWHWARSSWWSSAGGHRRYSLRRCTASSPPWSARWPGCGPRTRASLDLVEAYGGGSGRKVHQGPPVRGPRRIPLPR